MSADRCAVRRNYNRVELELVLAGRSMIHSRETAAKQIHGDECLGGRRSALYRRRGNSISCLRHSNFPSSLSMDEKVK